MRWLTVVVAVLGLAFVGAGCGGGDEEAADDDATVTITTETDTTDTGETTDDGTTDDGDGTGTGVLTEDCLAAVAAFLQQLIDRSKKSRLGAIKTTLRTSAAHAIRLRVGNGGKHRICLLL